MPEPRYQQLADQLLRDIVEGKYAVGSTLPAEVELSEHHGVSRHTMREAIRRLVDMGLLGRRQGVGTLVKSRQPRGQLVASLGSIDDLFNYTQRTRVKLVAEEEVTADKALAETFGCRRGQKWLKFATCRFPLRGNQPISYNDVYVLPGHRLIREGIEGEGVWIYGLIEKHYGERIVEVRQEIGTELIPARLAKLLKCQPGVPALHVVRSYFGSAERLLSMSVNWYPENRFKFSMRWRLEWDQGLSTGSESARPATMHKEVH